MHNYLLDITWNGLKGKRKGSACLFAAYFLSVTFAILNVSITGSLNKTREELRYDMYGEWNVAVYSPDPLGAALQEERIQSYGTAKTYGNLLDSGVTPLTGIGTLDDSLRTLGRLEVVSGRFPAKDNEIAIEADTLSSLGYDYKLGQTLTLRIMDKSAIEKHGALLGKDGGAAEQNQTVGNSDTVLGLSHTVGENSNTSIPGSNDIIQKEYILCGVLREYTGLWDTGTVEVALVGACVTENAAKELGDVCSYQYFLSTGREESHGLSQSLRREYENTVENNSAYGPMAKDEYHYFNLALILAITIAAVIAICSIQLKEQMRSLHLFRTIGATKQQLSIIIFYETMLLMLPAAAGGIAAGSMATWALLQLLMEQSPSAFHISIPAVLAAGILLLWFGAVFLTRFLTFRYSLRGSLSAQKRRLPWAGRRGRGVKRLGLLLLSSASMVTVIFCYMESLAPIYMDSLWSQSSSYTINQTTGQNGFQSILITDAFMERIKSLPGIRETVAWNQSAGTLEFSGMEENPFASLLMEHRYGVQVWDAIETAGQSAAPEGLWCRAYGIAEENWEKFFQYADGEIDREKFRDGEAVLLYLPYNTEAGIELDGQLYQDFGVALGDTVTITAYGMGELEEPIPSPVPGDDSLKSYKPYQQLMPTNRAKTEAVGIITANLEQDPCLTLFQSDNYYAVIGSNAFAKKLMEADRNGILLDKEIWSNQAYGYTNAFIYTGMDAGYFSTDYLMAKSAAEHCLMFTNQREEHAAYRQEALQALLHIWICGICMFLILALILLNTEMLHGFAQKRSFALLQAIGMSRRQLRARLAAKGLLMALASCLLGHVGYFLFFALKHIGTYQKFAEETDDTGTFFELLKAQFTGNCLEAGWSLPAHLSFCAFGMACVFLLFFAPQNRVLKETIRERLS